MDAPPIASFFIRVAAEVHRNDVVKYAQGGVRTMA